MLYPASFSPTLEYLAYLHHVKPMSNEYELHLATPDGSRDILYVSGYELEILSWAPDSVHFLSGLFKGPLRGSVCGGTRPLLDPPGTPAADISWVDGIHFLYAESWIGQPRQLCLGQLGGPSTVGRAVQWGRRLL